ncbi:PAS domain S-box-containing protein [Noviherbaspirillum humi]|uniref:histidine kinase n=1 Tax=Noviherbaspirillum humi TaxID=1688639 RepID=A0A239I4Z8_9BURK|nr:ATP-binding protein [Noviherbaspirillum humi]SNS88695.1 PAS domain S-box-containing protein [Noviherbaspirillum humi]
MAQRIANIDWTATPPGLPRDWPASFKTALNMMLAARFPMFLAWGNEQTFFYNDAFIDILAARHPDALGRRFGDLADGTREAISDLVGKVFSGESVIHEGLPFPLKREELEDTDRFTASYSPVCDEANTVCGVLCICMETTHQVDTNQALQAEINWMRNMFEQAPAPMAVLLGPDHCYEISNPANQAFLGNRPVIGRGVKELFPEVIEQGFTDILDTVYRTGVPFNGRDMPINYQSADGTPALVYMNVIYHPIRDHHHDIIGIFVIAADTTHAVTATQALKTSEARLQSLINTIPQLIWSVSPKGKPTYFNQQWYAFTGMPDGALNGWDAVHPEDREPNLAQWKISVVQGTTYEVKNRLRHHSGEYRWTLVRAVPVRDEAGRITEWIGSNTDIHAQELASEALNEIDVRKTEFLAMLAHELRNPLAPISASAELLSLRARGDPPLVNASAIISRQVEHIVRLVEDLLDTSRVTRGLVRLDRRPLDIKQVIADAVEQVRPAIERRKHGLTLDLGADPVYVFGDHNRLIQVVVNLLDNAAKYTPDGGRVSVTIDADADEVSLCVADSGIGMAPELVQHVFDLFFQGERPLDRAQGGLGIGLSIVKSLTELHGGRIAASSPGPGQGSQFRLTLPRRSSIEAPEATRQSVNEAQSPRLRILMVDDNVDAAFTMALLLETMGHQVVIEHSAAAALEQHRQRPFDLYILDIGLPRMNGYELVGHLRSSGTAPDSLFVALSGYGQEQDREASARAGFDTHLVKPANLWQLQELVMERQKRAAVAGS